VALFIALCILPPGVTFHWAAEALLTLKENIKVKLVKMSINKTYFLLIENFSLVKFDLITPRPQILLN
jgi:hypothetical protein